jgi:rubrerythrin
MRDFASLSEREILALAIALEEEDERIYADLSEGLRQDFPASATVFEGMRVEESNHRHRLTDLYREKFGDHIPLIRRQDVRGFTQRRPIWLAQPLRIEQVRKQAAIMEEETRCFYEKAAARSEDASVRQLLNDLAHEEREHQAKAHTLESAELQSGARMTEEQTQKRQFLLQIVQPGLVGLMDGSVSTLAPVFAAALATRSTWAAFLVGLAASFGAGISMGFAEALSDDGTLTGRGHPLARGFITGAMTALGGLGHTLPFLIGDFTVAFTVAAIVVLVELGVITWARHRYMEAPLLASALQVALGGAIVFAAGVLIGSF